MTNTEELIKIAIENGYASDRPAYARENLVTGFEGDIRFMVLDPLFWQALGKGLGWGDVLNSHPVYRNRFAHVWQVHWHYFIDHLAEGHSIEDYAGKLLSK